MARRPPGRSVRLPAAAVAWVALLFSAVLPVADAAALRAPCACGPHGVCSGGRCLCRSPYTGSRCERRAVVESGHYYALLESGPPTTPAPAAEARPDADSAALTAAERSLEAQGPWSWSGKLRAAVADGAKATKLDRWGERARVPVVGAPPHGAVGSAPLQSLVRAPSEWDESIDTVSDVNEMTRFLIDVGLIVAIIMLICCFSFMIKHSGQIGERIFYLISGDTRLRMNSMDVFGASVLPSTVIRIERMILHDVPDGENKDVYVEVDFGTNMIASTRVRAVQPVAAWSEPRVMQTLPEKDQPTANRVVFTDKLEFNVRPFGEGDFTFRVKDQNMMGSELLGTLKLPAYDIVKKAKQNADAPVLNYSACLSNPVKLSSGRHSRARMLLWVVLGED